MSLNEIQVIIIEKKIRQRTTANDVLFEEMLDHICCLVEDGMSDGLAFENALEQAFVKLSPKEINQCQKETYFLINRNRIIMKRITLATGALATVCLLITSVIFAQNIPSEMPLSNYKITSPFGKRIDPFSRELKYHFGIDLKAPEGTPVLATADGTVIEVEEQPDGYGKFVVLEHEGQFQTRYAQLSEFKVSIGTKIKKGSVVGLVGSSGRSTKPHLHYEVIKNGKRIDPMTIIKDS